MFMPECGISKPILSRVPTHFSFATHSIDWPVKYEACHWPISTVCTDYHQLWMLHTKCIDLETILRSSAQLAEPGFNASQKVAYFKTRCGDYDAWLRTPCKLGHVGSEDSPTSRVCRGGVRQTFGLVRGRRFPVRWMPAWLQKLF